jgi:nucleotide-binding universal stress UspA family protein
MHSTPGSLLLCHDGSDHAVQAIRAAAERFPDACADVLVIDDSSRSLVMLGPGALDTAAFDDVLRQSNDEARRIAQDGARIAEDAGLRATPIVRDTEHAPWRAIVEQVEDGDYHTVVIGSRGRSAIRTALLGSTSMGVVAHCRRPVLVVHVE